MDLDLRHVPRTPLFLGLAGLLPFLWGVATLWVEPLQRLTIDAVGPRVLLSYGTVILSFMSGVLWGFAAKGRGGTGYALSVIPALWAFFFVGGGPVSASIYLIAGFLGVLAIDWVFWRSGMTPPWWMALRVALTAIVVACLAVVALP